MRYIYAFIFLLAGFESVVAQAPGGNSGSVRITVQIASNPESLSGVVVTLLPLPTPAPSTLTLPENEEAWLTYMQNPASANLPVMIPGRAVMTPAEARQKLAVPGTAIYEVSGGVSQPVLTKNMSPEYSAAARQNRVQGTVEAIVVLRGDGTIGGAEITKSVGYGLDENAIAAFKQWQFRPAFKDGIAVPVYLSLSVGFTMRASSVARTATTDAKGLAVFNNLDAGRYAVRGAREGFVGAISAVVAPQAAAEIQLPLKPAAIVGGVVSDANGMPIPNARVALGVIAVQDGQRFFYPGAEVTTNSRGEYLLTAVAAGNYYLRAATTYYPGTNDLSQATALPIQAGQDVRAVNFAVPK